jgi:hypothetical protein
MHTSIGSLRDEDEQGDASLLHEITRSSLSNKVWMPLLTGTMLAVRARGFKRL